MEDKQLRELMDYLASSSFVEFELEREGFKLRLVKAGATPKVTPSVEGAAPDAADRAPSPGPETGPQTPSPAVSGERDSLETIISPMVGTFYRAPNPNADPFVEVGEIIEPGQVIGIVEAMKLMNEIEADRRGEIVEIPVANGQPVEYGEALFRVRPLV